VRLTLVHDVADRYEEGSAEGEHGGDIRLLVKGGHRAPFVVLDQSVGKRIRKAVRTRHGDLFE
jgi:hypothetical protein